MSPWSRSVFNLNHRAWREIRKRHPGFKGRQLDARLRVCGRLFSTLHVAQQAVFGRALRDVAVSRPVFILGHWRSGTSLLHELLALDEQMVSPTTFACFNPHNFLLTPNPLGNPATEQVARPTNDLMVAPNSPQEEEFALLCLGATSGYEAFMFPQAMRQLDTLSNPTNLTGEEARRWDAAMLGFLRAVMYASARAGCF